MTNEEEADLIVRKLKYTTKELKDASYRTSTVHMGKEPPSFPAAGTLWVSTVDNLIHVYTGTMWAKVQ